MIAGGRDHPEPQEGEGCHRYGSPSRAGWPAQADADGGSRRSPWISGIPTSPGPSGCSAKRGGRLAPGHEEMIRQLRLLEAHQGAVICSAGILQRGEQRWWWCGAGEHGAAGRPPLGGHERWQRASMTALPPCGLQRPGWRRWPTHGHGARGHGAPLASTMSAAGSSPERMISVPSRRPLTGHQYSRSSIAAPGLPTGWRIPFQGIDEGLQDRAGHPVILSNRSHQGPAGKQHHSTDGRRRPRARRGLRLRDADPRRPRPAGAGWSPTVARRQPAGPGAVVPAAAPFRSRPPRPRRPGRRRKPGWRPLGPASRDRRRTRRPAVSGPADEP